MGSPRIECLRCGDTRARRQNHRVDDHECRRCGYVGWASSAELTESQRRNLRERPVESRRVRLVV
jgi:Zn ribbon nucleic-acid-binding protein